VNTPVINVFAFSNFGRTRDQLSPGSPGVRFD
jgi:hypothetical protein